MIMGSEQRGLCPICKLACKFYLLRDREDNEELLLIDCVICSKYEISFGLFSTATESDILVDMGKRYQGKNYILSGVTKNSKKMITITRKNITDLIDQAPVPETPLEMIDKIILYLCFRPFFAGKKIETETEYPRFFAEDKRELSQVLIEANKLGYLEGAGDGKYKLTTKGWERADELRRTNPDSRQAFVAMWFNEEEMGSAFEDGFEPALKETGYKPYRVDRDRGNNDMIDNKVIAEIRRSGLLVVDLTGIRGSVIFEAGFAMGLGVEVIWTCRKDYKEKMKKDNQEFPFDIRQFPFIFWETHDHLKNELKDKIGALCLSTKR